VPAGPLEEHVVEQIRAIGRNPELVTQTLAQARQQDQQQLTELEAERQVLDKDLARWDNDLRAQTARLAHADDVGEAVSRLGELQNRIDLGKRRLLRVKEQMQTVRGGMLHEADAGLVRQAWAGAARRRPARGGQLLRCGGRPPAEGTGEPTRGPCRDNGYRPARSEQGLATSTERPACWASRTHRICKNLIQLTLSGKG
jgi:hypothetical protein